MAALWTVCILTMFVMVLAHVAGKGDAYALGEVLAPCRDTIHEARPRL